MAVKMQFGRLASVGKKSDDGAWRQVMLSPCTPDGAITSNQVIRAYADNDLLLTFGQICAVQSAKKGDKVEIMSDVTLNGKDYKKGDKYEYDRDSTRVIGVGMRSVSEISAQLDRLVRMSTVKLPASQHEEAFQVTEGAPLTEQIEA